MRHLSVPCALRLPSAAAPSAGKAAGAADGDGWRLINLAMHLTRSATTSNPLTLSLTLTPTLTPILSRSREVVEFYLEFDEPHLLDEVRVRARVRPS